MPVGLGARVVEALIGKAAALGTALSFMAVIAISALEMIILRKVLG